MPTENAEKLGSIDDALDWTLERIQKPPLGRYTSVSVDRAMSARVSKAREIAKACKIDLDFNNAVERALELEISKAHKRGGVRG